MVPLSRILQDVCKQDSEVDCSGIPGMLETMSSMADEETKNKLLLAKDGLGFFCDPCLDPIRDGVVSLGLPSPPSGAITPDGAMKATCQAPAGCMAKWQVCARAHRAAEGREGVDLVRMPHTRTRTPLADRHPHAPRVPSAVQAIASGVSAGGEPAAMTEYAQLEKDCDAGATGTTIAGDSQSLLLAIKKGLEPVRGIVQEIMGTGPYDEDAKAETPAAVHHANARHARHRKPAPPGGVRLPGGGLGAPRRRAGREQPAAPCRGGCAGASRVALVAVL